jgi:hypothetical protein
LKSSKSAGPRGCAVSVLLIAATVRSVGAFEFAREGEPAIAPADVVLEATTEDVRGGVWMPDSRSPETPNVFLPRRASTEDGAFTLLGDRIRATVKRTRGADAGLGITDAASSGAAEGSQSYRVEADIYRRGEVGLSAYGSYRQAPSTAPSAADSYDQDAASAGLNLGVGKWRSWIERRESPDDVAMSHISNATRILTYSTGFAYAPAGGGVERLRMGLSRSEPTARVETTEETSLAVPSDETRRTIEVAVAERWQIGTTRLQFGRGITGAADEPEETENSIRLAHQHSAGPWRAEALFGFSTVRDDRPTDAFERHAYEISARIAYVGEDAPDLTGRATYGEASMTSLASDETDINASWQVSGTIGFGKFLTGGARDASRFVDLNFGLKRDDATAAQFGQTLSASVGVAAGLRF